jgi:hypothetical protein
MWFKIAQHEFPDSQKSPHVIRAPLPQWTYSPATKQQARDVHLLSFLASFCLSFPVGIPLLISGCCCRAGSLSVVEDVVSVLTGFVTVFALPVDMVDDGMKMVGYDYNIQQRNKTRYVTWMRRKAQIR